MMKTALTKYNRGHLLAEPRILCKPNSCAMKIPPLSPMTCNIPKWPANRFGDISIKYIGTMLEAKPKPKRIKKKNLKMKPKNPTSLKTGNQTTSQKQWNTVDIFG